MPVAATQRYLEIIILTEVKQRQIHHIYIIFLKRYKQTHYKTKTDFENKLMVTKGEMQGGEIN